MHAKCNIKEKIKIFLGRGTSPPKTLSAPKFIFTSNYFNGVNDQILENKTKTKVSEPVQGLFAPRYFRFSEQKFPLTTFAPGSESSRELSLPGMKVLSGNFRSRDSQFAFFSGKYSLLMIITLIPRRRKTIPTYATEGVTSRAALTE